MPGLNQRGPMGEGPVTGRGTGRCAAPAQDTARGWRGPGNGRNRTMGRGRCQQNRWSADMPENLQAFCEPEPVSEESLARRARELEMELKTIKNQLEQKRQ